jgi:hypothetical protein
MLQLVTSQHVVHSIEAEVAFSQFEAVTSTFGHTHLFLKQMQSLDS